jgi:hypothetical protein
MLGFGFMKLGHELCRFKFNGRLQALSASIRMNISHVKGE